MLLAVPIWSPCGNAKQLMPLAITYPSHTYTCAQKHTSLLSYREIKTTLEQKMKKKKTTLTTASCHSPFHLISAMETSTYFLAFHPFISLLIQFHSCSFPLLFWHLKRGMGPGLKRLLSYSLLLVLTVSVAGCPWQRPSQP